MESGRLPANDLSHDDDGALPPGLRHHHDDDCEGDAKDMVQVSHL